MRNLLVSILMLFLLAGCSTLELNVDYDTSYNFDNKTKYIVIHSDRGDENNLITDRIAKAIKDSLNQKGYTEVSQNSADLIFAFHVNVKNRTDVQMDYESMGFGGFGMGFGGNIIATPTTYNYTEGKLIIDALNPTTQKIVWRGLASDELDKGATPQARTAYINKVVTKMMAQFPPKESK